jgi:hypothetical protein
MIFINQQDKKQVESYTKLLKVMGSLSNLYSDSSVPYLNYRVSENLFCRSFDAKNLSRSDVSADASKNNVGVGIKTFVEGSGNSWQKVAEFNRDSHTYSGRSEKEIVNTVTKLRNERINATKRIHALEDLIYHCVVRNTGKMSVYELNMDLIQEDSIKGIDTLKNVIKFQDGLHEYSFNVTKSTLYERFITPKDVLEVDVKILADPFEKLEVLLSESAKELVFEPTHKDEIFVYLPLYSDRSGKVEEKSGLNQWNAGGRTRNEFEVYIPIPLWIHKKFPKFFPARDTSFNLELPNGEVISASVCQSGGKALMSNPNKKLGEWLLRDVLNLKQGELVTSNKLRIIGLDSVVIHKKSEKDFTINFSKTGSFENFKRDINI